MSLFVLELQQSFHFSFWDFSEKDNWRLLTLDR